MLANDLGTGDGVSKETNMKLESKSESKLETELEGKL